MRVQTTSNPFARTALNTNDLAGGSHSLFEGVGGKTQSTPPMRYLKICIARLDGIIVHDKQRGFYFEDIYIVLGISLSSRTISGFWITYGTPNEYSVAACLANCFSDKNYVKTKYPEIRNKWHNKYLCEYLILDPTFSITRYLQDVCQNLGIVLIYSWKPDCQDFLIERIIRGLKSSIIKAATPIEQDPYLVSYRIGSAELKRVIHSWIIDEYHESPLTQLQQSPAQFFRCWENKDRGFVSPPQQKELKRSFLKTETGRLTKSGVEFEHLYYNSPELQNFFQKYKKKMIAIEIDPTDLSKIIVQKHDGALKMDIPALEPRYAKNLSYDQHMAILNSCKKLILNKTLLIDPSVGKLFESTLRSIFEDTI